PDRARPRGRARRVLQAGTGGGPVTGVIRARMTELGIELPTVAAPLAAYVPAVVSGNHVFTSGQLPTVNGELQGVGKLGAELTTEQGAELARISALNALAAVEAVIGSLDR